MIDFDAAMDDPALFGPWFHGPSWDGWRAIGKAAFALPMTDEEKAFFAAVAGARAPSGKRAKELWIAAGRRAGKDSFASLIVAHAAATFDGADRLRPGERPLCLCLATDKEQAKIVLGYVRSYFAEIPPLAAMIERETQFGFELNNSVDVYVSVNSFRAVRGRTILCAVLDEIAFWRSEDSFSPDYEVYRAIKPGMATLPESMLIAISSPYRRAGLLYSKFKQHYGAGGDTIFVKAPSRVLNPSLDQAEIDRAVEEDPAAAASEWMAEFRADISGFLSVELIETAVDSGIAARTPRRTCRYFGFADPSSGTGKDSFALAIAHTENEVAVIDVVHEIKPPFNPQSAAAECASILRSYECRTVVGDRYAPGFVSEAFARHGVTYRYSERDRSQLYLEALPLFSSGRVRLVENRRLVSQLAALERRTSSSGRDRIDHPRDAHDDISNAVAGALVEASQRRGCKMIVSPLKI